jgi:hypothetical protein
VVHRNVVRVRLARARRGTRSSAAFVALACLTAPANAQGEQKREVGPYSLSFVRGPGAESCPSRQELEREVSTRLGRSAFEPSAERSIEILTEHGPDGYRSIVSAIDRDGNLLGRRILISDDTSCAPIFSATALAVALLVDPEGALSRDSGANEAVGRFEIDEPTPPPLPPPSAPVPAPPHVPAPLPPAAAGVSPVRERPVAATGVEAVVTLGVVPAVSPGVGLFTEGFWGGDWGFALTGLYVSKASITEGNVVLDVSLTTFGAALTFSPIESRSFRLVTDAGLSTGALHVGVRGARALDSGDHLHLALGLGARAEAMVIGSFFLTARLGAAVPLIHRGLFVEGHEEPIWREPPIGGLASLGAGWAFF